MIRQVLGCVLTLAGILVTFVFWYEVIPLAPKFAAWDRDPANVFLILSIWALLGGFSCLLLSRHIANWAMRVDLLPLDQTDADVERAERIVASALQKQGWAHKPQLGIYEKPEVNAFIAGFSSQNSSLALSRGAIKTLNDADLEILITRELIHFKSGDLLALAFMEGLLFAFTLYVARMLAFLLGTSLRQTEEEATSSGAVELLVTGSLMLLLALPGALVFWFFSRLSARRADTLTAKAVGREAYTTFLGRLPRVPPQQELFSAAFKFQSFLQPNLTLRSQRLSA